jgi:hypothetical protein
MLTILLRHADGSEELFEAEKLHRLNPPDTECVPAMGTFIAHGVVLSGVPSDYFEFAIGGPFGAVFVMNENGSTVARYFAGGQGTTAVATAA